MPILVPVTQRVNGMIAAISTRKGSERPILATQLITVYPVRWVNSPPGARLCSSTPRGVPSSTATDMAIPTMASVCPRAGSSSPGMSESAVL